MKFKEIRRISPQEAYREWKAGRAALVDVRSQFSYARDARQIPGSIRVDPRSLREQPVRLPSDGALILYCS